MSQIKRSPLLFFIFVLVFSLIPASSQFRQFSQGNPLNITFSDDTVTVRGETDNLFWEVWNASNTNGWNVCFQNVFGFQYGINASLLQIGDDENLTDASDSNVQVLFFDSCIWEIKNNATLTLGKLIDETRKITSGGVSVKTWQGMANEFCVQEGGKCYLYNFEYSEVTVETGAQFTFQDGSQARIWNSRFSKPYRFDFDTGNVDFYNVEAINASIYHTFFYDSGVPTFENVWFHGTYYPTESLYITANAPLTIKNLKASGRHTEYWEEELFKISTSNPAVYLINPVISEEDWLFNFIGTDDCKVHRQYEFSLNITNSSGSPLQNCNVTVSHYGENAGQDFSVLTGSNGSFATKVLTRSFYNDTGGNSEYFYGPWNLEVTHPDYPTLNYNFTDLDSVINWKVALTSPIEGEGEYFFDFVTSLALLGVPAILGLLAFVFLLAKRRENERQNL